MIKHYKTQDLSVWNGRVDDVNDPDSFRWHQVVKAVDLNNPAEIKNTDLFQFCFLGFECDKGIEKNIGRTGASNGPISIRKEMANLPCNFKTHNYLTPGI